MSYYGVFTRIAMFCFLYFFRFLLFLYCWPGYVKGIRYYVKLASAISRSNYSSCSESLSWFRLNLKKPYEKRPAGK